MTFLGHVGIPSLHPWTICITGYTYISSITPSAGTKSLKYTGPAGWGSRVAATAGCGAAATVRYGF